MTDEDAWIVAAIRLWSEGENAENAAFAAAIDERIGVARGRQVVSLFGDLMRLMADHARRPILRHRPSCSCVGADEAVFANFVAVATHGAREDAMMIATLFLRPDIAPIAVSLAQTLGLDLARGLAARRSRAPQGVTLH